jgi:hypothetical protein
MNSIVEIASQVGPIASSTESVPQSRETHTTANTKSGDATIDQSSLLSPRSQGDQFSPCQNKIQELASSSDGLILILTTGSTCLFL